MRSALIFASFILAAISLPCSADVSFHLAYQRERPDSVPAVFSNDRSFRYASRKPYILSSELLEARVVKSKYRYAVEIVLAPSALEKFNSLVERNLRAQNRGDFAAQVGLGAFVDGQPRELIQGVFHPLSKNSLWWTVYPGGLTPHALREANARAAAISRRK